MENPNAFSNHLMTILNHELSISKVDLSHLKRETTKHESRLMEVDWGGNIDPNYTSTTKHGPSLKEVDSGGNILIPTTHQVDACSCMLTGEENSESSIEMNVCPLRLIGELMKPIKVDTASLKLIGEIMIQVFTLWMDACSLKLIGESMVQASSFILCTLIMMQSQRITSPKIVGRTTTKSIFDHSCGVLERFS